MMSGSHTFKVQSRTQISPFGELVTCRVIHTVFRLHDTGHRKEHKSTRLLTKPAIKNKNTQFEIDVNSTSWILVKFAYRAESNGQKLLLDDREYKAMLTVSYGGKWSCQTML